MPRQPLIWRTRSWSGCRRRARKRCSTSSAPRRLSPTTQTTVRRLDKSSAPEVTAAIQAISLPSQTPSVPCSCDPTVNLTLATVNIGTDVTCNVTFSDGYFDVMMGLPDLHIAVNAIGWTAKRTPGPVCVDRTSIGEQATADVTGITFGFRVTQSALLGNTVCDNGSAPPCVPPVFFKGNACDGRSRYRRIRTLANRE